MNPEKAGQIKEEIEVINNIILMAQECLKVARYLWHSSGHPKENYLREHFLFFQFTRDIYWRIIVLEVCKLLSNRENDKFNLAKFISKLKHNGHYGDLNISPERIKHWENDLTKKQEDIDNLLEQRDKSYAHKDKLEVVNEVSFETIEKLIIVGQEIVKEIKFEVSKTTYLYNMGAETPVGNLKTIFKFLIERDDIYADLEKDLGSIG